MFFVVLPKKKHLYEVNFLKSNQFLLSFAVIAIKIHLKGCVKEERKHDIIFFEAFLPLPSGLVVTQIIFCIMKQLLRQESFGL